MLRRGLIAGLGALVGIALAGTGTAAVTSIHLRQVTRHVQAGGFGSVTVTVIPKARCTIYVATATTRSSAALSAHVGGKITWRWQVRENAPSGRSPIIVNCGKSRTAKVIYTIIPPQPAMSLEEAKAVICDRSISQLAAAFGGPVIASPPTSTGCSFTIYGAPPLDRAIRGYLSLTVRSPAPCVFEVRSATGFPRPYTETCASLK